MEKHSESRLANLFAHLHLLSFDAFISDLLSSDLFSSDSSHLCFSTVRIVGSFTSKLPLIIYSIYKVEMTLIDVLNARRRSLRLGQNPTG